jgi:hypothetical protein
MPWLSKDLSQGDTSAPQRRPIHWAESAKSALLILEPRKEEEDSQGTGLKGILQLVEKENFFVLVIFLNVNVFLFI